MTLTELGALGEFVGGIAVLVTLIYLVVQLRQNTTTTRSSAYQSWIAVHDNLFSSLQDEKLSRTIVEGCQDTRNLSDDNYVSFINWMRRYLYMQQAQYYLFRKGVIDKELWECNLNDMIGVFRFPGVRQYREAGATEHFTEGFVSIVESTNSDSPMLDWSKEKGFFATPYHQK